MNSFKKHKDPPITMIVSRRVKPGYESAFEQVIVNMTATTRRLERFPEVNIFRSLNSDNAEYCIIFKFDCISKLRRWERSAVRRQWLIELNKFTLSCSEIPIVRGIETWFTLPIQRAIAPPRYKMALITWLAIFPLIVLINAMFAPLLNQLPSITRSLLPTIILVLLMTYLLMPIMTKIFVRWLYPQKTKLFR